MFYFVYFFIVVDTWSTLCPCILLDNHSCFVCDCMKIEIDSKWELKIKKYHTVNSSETKYNELTAH